MKISKLLTGLMTFLALPSLANNLEQQREIYQRLTEVVITQSEPNYELTKQMLMQLEGYPLQSYAEFMAFNPNMDDPFQQLDEHEQRYPDFPFTKQLREQWLIWLLDKQDWQAILKQSDKMQKNSFSQCLLILAEWKQQKLSQKDTALLPQKTIEQLWLSLNKSPISCHELFAEWNKQGGLTDDLIQQRTIVSFENKNKEELEYLLSYTTDKSQISFIKMLLDLLNKPQHLQNYSQFISPEDANPAPIYGKVIDGIMPAYIKTLNADKNWKPIEDFNQFEQWAEFWKLSEAQLSQWKEAYLSHFFDQKQTEFQQWRDEQLQILKADKLTERRIRMAIRQKQEIKPWLDLLSEEAKQKEEWLYWTAQYDNPELAKQKLEQLSKARGFYAVLAAHQLNQVYQPTIKTLAKQPNQTAEIILKSANALARIKELLLLDEKYKVTQEWANLLSSADFQQKLELADYALQQNWYDLAVEATIQAKAWDYLSLRLPNAYLNLFDLHLNNKKIHRTFAMAIARQESAWKSEAVSHANAIGLMQLLPTTAVQTAGMAELHYKNEQQLKIPFYNIMLGTAHLQQLYDKYGDNRILIAAAYNAGANRVDKWLSQSQGKLNMAEFVASIPFLETRNYVQNVIAYDAYYQILQQKPQHLFSKQELDQLY